VIELRAFEPADHQALISWLPTEDALRDFAGPGVRWPLDRTQLDQRAAEPGLLQSWSVCEPPSPRPVGHIELLRAGPRQASIDRVAIAPQHRGRGLAAEVVRMALGHARDLGFDTVDLLVFAGNASAVRTYLTVGFTDAGPVSPDFPTVRRMSSRLRG